MFAFPIVLTVALAASPAFAAEERWVPYTPMSVNSYSDAPLNERQGILSYSGASGAGKSSLVRVIAGPDGGRFEGAAPDRDGWIVWRGPEIFVYDGQAATWRSLRQAMEMARIFGGIGGGGQVPKEIDAALAEICKQMRIVIDNLPKDLSVEERRLRARAILDAVPGGDGCALPGDLGGGEQTRTGLALPAIEAPEILLLDEPLAPLRGYPVMRMRVLFGGNPRWDILAAPPRSVDGGVAVIAGLTRLAALYADITGEPLPAASLIAIVAALRLVPVEIADLVEDVTWTLEEAGVQPFDAEALRTE